MIARFAKWLSSWRPRASKDEFSELSPEERAEIQEIRDVVEDFRHKFRELQKTDPAILRAWRDHLIEQEKGKQ